MKKRFLALVLCACILIGAVASGASAVTQVNTLISKSYLETVFLQELQNLISGRVTAAFNNTYTAASHALNALGGSYLAQLKPEGDDETEWLTAGSLVEQVGEIGDTITLNLGASLILRSGSASFVGTLIDTTAGQEVSDGELVITHRYVAAEKTVISIGSEQAEWSVEGQWTTTAEQVEPEPEVPLIQFVDVPETEWYHDEVYYVVGRGLFNGTSETTFEPYMTMTRSMLTTVLHRMAGSPEVTYSAVFTDVPDGTWYTAGTVWAGQNGIATGSESGEFYPDDPVTRDQIAQMLYNYANLFGFDTSGRGDLSGFADVNEIAAWAQDAFSWAVSVGLFRGNDRNQLMPTSDASRAEIATLLHRFDLLMNP